MNKLTKSALATGVATALLLGGGATLALWNDSVTVGAATEINSGVLTLDASDSQWSQSPELWVPGDLISYTTDITIVAEGDNLLSELSIDPSSVTGDPELLAALEYSIDVANVSGGTLTMQSPDLYTVVPGSAPSSTITATVTVNVKFPANSVTDLTAQQQQVNISDLNLLLQQVSQ